VNTKILTALVASTAVALIEFSPFILSAHAQSIPNKCSFTTLRAGDKSNLKWADFKASSMHNLTSNNFVEFKNNNSGSGVQSREIPFNGLGSVSAYILSQSSIRSRVSLQCPGSRNSLLTLQKGSLVIYGIGHPENQGTCPLSIGSLDAQGRLLEPHLVLNPGEGYQWFYPPAGAVQIVVGCFTNCSGGTGILEYDTPNS
jgi:hypothetical protein